MNVREVLRRSTEHLAAHGSETPRLDAELLLAHALDVTRIDLYMGLDRPLEGAELDAARSLVARRARREPLQYVLGEWGFRRLTLTVDARALIPRPETEVLVERALALLDRDDAPRVLDVGTGSGAVALALSDEHPDARVTAMDASEAALALAAENVRRTGLAVNLLLHDVGCGLPPGPWDLVVANPPYVLGEEIRELPPEVARWEPRDALLDEGQTEAIVAGAGTTLAVGAALVLEVHPGRALEVASMLARSGFGEVVVTRDLAGRERVVEGVRV